MQRLSDKRVSPVPAICRAGDGVMGTDVDLEVENITEDRETRTQVYGELAGVFIIIINDQGIVYKHGSLIWIL